MKEITKEIENKIISFVNFMTKEGFLTYHNQALVFNNNRGKIEINSLNSTAFIDQFREYQIEGRKDFDSRILERTVTYKLKKKE